MAGRQLVLDRCAAVATASGEAGSRTVKRGAVTFALTRGLDRSAVQLHQSADQCESDPKPSLGAVDRDVRLDEQVEDMREHVRTRCRSLRR